MSACGSDWLVRTASAALRKGDARLTLERVREQELVETSLADMAAGIVAGEQQVALDLRRSFTVEQFAPHGEE